MANYPSILLCSTRFNG